VNNLLSIDWDFFSGTLEHVFDSPLWGSPDLEFDRLERWRERARLRGASTFDVLGHDFPLLGHPRSLLRFVGLPTFAVNSHDAAYGLLEALGISSVTNVDSHHDLFSSSGDANRVRPGNWAGLALERGLIDSYRCVYPGWHAGVRVGEGFDLERTWSELGARTWLDRIRLERSDSALDRLEPASFAAAVLVLSPAWSNPLHDPVFFGLASQMKANLEPGLRDRSSLKPSSTQCP
jgi:hypothetical protein